MGKWKKSLRARGQGESVDLWMWMCVCVCIERDVYVQIGVKNLSGGFVDGAVMDVEMCVSRGMCVHREI